MASNSSPEHSASVPPTAFGYLKDLEGDGTWKASEADWATLEEIGEYRNHKLVALSLGLCPENGVTGRIAQMPAVVAEREERDRIVRYKLSVVGGPDALRYVQNRENDSVARGTSQNPKNRIVTVIEFVDFLEQYPKRPIAQRMLEVAKKLQAAPKWAEVARDVDRMRKTRYERSAEAKEMNSIARVLLGLLIDKYGLVVRRPGTSGRPFDAAVSDEMVRTIQGALVRAEFDDINAETVRAAVNNAARLLNDKEINRATRPSKARLGTD